MSGKENSDKAVPKEQADTKGSISSLHRKRGVHGCKVTIYLKKFKQLDGDNWLTPSFCQNQVTAFEVEMS